MKRINTLNKLLSALTLTTPLTGVVFNSQYQNTQKIITENNNSLNNYFGSNSETKMGDITVNVDGTVIKSYVSGQGKLKITPNITEIDQNAFKNNLNITSLDLSNAAKLTKIDNFAFLSCENLTGELYIPRDLTDISDLGVFRNTKFTSLRVASENIAYSKATNLGPDALVLIDSADGIYDETSYRVGNFAFGDIILPDTLTELSSFAFENTNIKSVDFTHARGLTNVDDNTFRGSSVTSVIIGSNIQWIKGGAFAYTPIQYLDLTQAFSLTALRDSCFMGCSQLTGNLTFPKSLTEIGPNVFKDVALENLIFTNVTTTSSSFTFGENWIDPSSVNGTVYLPQGRSNQYLSATNFGFESGRTQEWTYNSASSEIQPLVESAFDTINISSNDVGNSDKLFLLTGCTPENLSNAATWYFIPQGETEKAPEGLFISAGTIFWNHINPGTYTFKVATNLNETVKQTSETITIKVSSSSDQSNTGLIIGLTLAIGLPVILVGSYFAIKTIKNKKKVK